MSAAASGVSRQGRLGAAQLQRMRQRRDSFGAGGEVRLVLRRDYGGTTKLDHEQEEEELLRLLRSSSCLGRPR